MSLSKKIILALSVSVAYLTIMIGCGVDDPDIEKKGVFKCQSNDDCLTGSQCVKAKDSDPYGECIREKDIDHCRDNDHDGYSTETSPEYANECGFSETYPRDPDDGNPLIFPNAPELCDGVDNSGDGCTDGIKNDKGECEDLISPCWGVGDYTEYNDSACAAKYIGVTICINGKQVHGVLDGSGKIVEDTNGGSCPKTQDQLIAMTESQGDHRFNQVSNEEMLAGKGSDLAPNFDNNCDGIFDYVKCESTNEKCVVTGGGEYGAETAYYKDAINACTAEGKSEADCECVGTKICQGTELVCANSSGTKIEKSSLNGKSCFTE